MDLAELIQEVLRTPKGSVRKQPTYGFEALKDDGSLRPGYSEQILAETARAALTNCVPGVVFNDIAVHRDEYGQIMRIEVNFMDEIHDPSARATIVDYTE